MQARGWLAIGAILGGLGVLTGAFGAHGLEGRLTPERLETWEVAVRYQIYHALALVLLGILGVRSRLAGLNAAGFCFLSGVLIFSGLLYALCLTEIRMLGVIVPIGGVLLIVGWFVLAGVAVRGLRLPAADRDAGSTGK